MISEGISNNTPPQNEKFEYGYPISNELLLFCPKLEGCKPHNAAHHPTKYDVINDVKLFLGPTVYRRIYCRKFLTLTNQKLRYKSKCIRIHFTFKKCLLILTCAFLFQINPPYFVPLVEIIPAPFTKPEVTQKVRQLMEDIGQSPITLRREALGFALNRIQYACINECWNMYKVITVNFLKF